MKAKANLVINYAEIEQAEKLNYEGPDPKYKEFEINFDISGVNCYYLNMDGNINMSLFGEAWTIMYDKELIKALDKQINKNNE